MKADYIFDDHDYESFEDIEKRYYDKVIIWVAGSSPYGEDFSAYYVLLQYKEHKEFMYGRVKEATPNQAALIGVKKALEKIFNLLNVLLLYFMVFPAKLEFSL